MTPSEIFDAAGLTVFERGWLSANNILFVGDNHHEAVLVDTGYCSHSDQTVALVEHALSGRPLQRAVNTHLHSDHCGGNHALQQAYGCRIDVPIGEAAAVDGWNQELLSFRATGQECPRFERAGVVGDQELTILEAKQWQVLPAGGHDPSSVMFYQPEFELLISADALWENGFGVIFPELEGQSAFAEARATLDRIAELKVRCVIPGHGQPFIAVGRALDTAYRRLDGFVADPVRHARHAAKVLIKFHLLTIGSGSMAELLGWARATACLRRTHSRYFKNERFDVWFESLTSDLCQSGAARRDRDCVFNS